MKQEIEKILEEFYDRYYDTVEPLRIEAMKIAVDKISSLFRKKLEGAISEMCPCNHCFNYSRKPIEKLLAELEEKQ